MKTIATLDPENARVLAAFLAKQSVACDTRDGLDENGLETTELLVQDDAYDSACEAIERWEAEMTAKTSRTTSRLCPTCGSPHVEYVEDFDYEKSMTQIGAVYRCNDCKRIFASRR